MTIQPRGELLNIVPAYHGAMDYMELEKLGIHPDDVLDFSVNSNPFGPSASVMKAIPRVPLDRYPDRHSLALRRALADRLNISEEQIVIGNGTAELIQLAAFTYLQRGDRVLILEPAFGEYERSARLMGAVVKRWRASISNEFAFEDSNIQEMLLEGNYRMVFVCNPNNPTGQLIKAETLQNWANLRPQTLFVVDEAYIRFAPEARPAIGLAENILVLRSMTKDYALAGLRLGYAAGNRKIISALQRACPAWNVNALAQAAGLAALQDDQHIQQSMQALLREKKKLMASLSALGYHLIPSHTHFFLLQREGVKQFRRDLLQRGMLVRDCESFGLPQFVRIATRRSEENARLLLALQELQS